MQNTTSNAKTKKPKKYIYIFLYDNKSIFLLIYLFNKIKTSQLLFLFHILGQEAKPRRRSAQAGKCRVRVQKKIIHDDANWQSSAKLANSARVKK